MSGYFYVRAAFKQRVLCFLGGETHWPNRRKLKKWGGHFEPRKAFLSLGEMMSNLVRVVGLLVRCLILTVDSEWQNSRALSENCTEGGKENEILPQTQLLYVPNWSNKGFRGFRTFRP